MAAFFIIVPILCAILSYGLFRRSSWMWYVGLAFLYIFAGYFCHFLFNALSNATDGRELISSATCLVGGLVLWLPASLWWIDIRSTFQEKCKPEQPRSGNAAPAKAKNRGLPKLADAIECARNVRDFLRKKRGDRAALLRLERPATWFALALLLPFVIFSISAAILQSKADAIADNSAHAALTAEILEQLASVPDGKSYPDELSDLMLTFRDGGNAALLDRFIYESTGTACTVRTRLGNEDVSQSFSR